MLREIALRKVNEHKGTQARLSLPDWVYDIYNFDKRSGEALYLVVEYDDDRPNEITLRKPTIRELRLKFEGQKLIDYHTFTKEFVDEEAETARDTIFWEQTDFFKATIHLESKYPDPRIRELPSRTRSIYLALPNDEIFTFHSVATKFELSWQQARRYITILQAKGLVLDAGEVKVPGKGPPRKLFKKVIVVGDEPLPIPEPDHQPPPGMRLTEVGKEMGIALWEPIPKSELPI